MSDALHYAHGGATLKRCPVCDDDHVHIGDVRVFQPRDNYSSQVVRVGAAIEIVGLEKTACRGVGVEIEYWCENGEHRWVEGQAHHKGETRTGWQQHSG